MAHDVPRDAIPRAMSRTPLPPPPPHGSDTLALIDAMLDRAALDPEIQGRFYAPEAIAERAAQAERLRADDWPALSRYREPNSAVASPRLVMIGDSLTEIWGHALPDMFGSDIVNRGISGQTSPQILLRFYPDVVALKPRAVHILCGANDVAGNTGPNLPEDFQRNMLAMLDIAQANGIRVLIASLTPAASAPWNPEARPLEWIPYLNAWLSELAGQRGLTFIDYYAALTDGKGGLQPQFSGDGVHVTRAAYHVMRRILEGAL